MGINAQQHRVCIGKFNSIKCKFDVKKDVCYLSVLSQLCTPTGIFVSLLISYLYILLFIILMTLDLASVSSGSGNLTLGEVGSLPCLHSNINLYILVIMSSLLLRHHRGDSNIFKSKSVPLLVRRSLCLSMRWLGVLTILSIYIFSLNMLLLVKCNTSILNPGPKNGPLSIFYNNVQGLINTRDLASDNPPLNMTKLHELHGFLYTNKPDIVILNETWLKNRFSIVKFYHLAIIYLDWTGLLKHILGTLISQRSLGKMEVEC